jgi:hypothetical protein
MDLAIIDREEMMVSLFEDTTPMVNPESFFEEEALEDIQDRVLSMDSEELDPGEPEPVQDPFPDVEDDPYDPDQHYDPDDDLYVDPDFEESEEFEEPDEPDYSGDNPEHIPEDEDPDDDEFDEDLEDDPFIEEGEEELPDFPDEYEEIEPLDMYSGSSLYDKYF